jgi:hypothetical protein
VQSLGEILRHQDPAYLRYLSKKTQYLITQDKHEFVHKFWQHLIVEYHPLTVIPKLPQRHQKTFFQLLHQFGHDARAGTRKKYIELEKKIPWVLQHPNGGYFVPYEIIKTLMPRNRAIPYGFLFQLIYAMPAEEQDALRSLLARSHRSHEALQNEKHPLDRTLAIYIWTTAHQKPPARKAQVATSTTPSRSVWHYLEEQFPKFSNEIAEWQHLMQTGRKGFYRALSLVRGADLLKRHAASLRFVPVAPRKYRYFPMQPLRYVVPLEFIPEKNALKPQ